jgi:hypothetical protein
VKYFYALTNYFGTTEAVAVSLDNPRDSGGPLRRRGDTRGTQYLTLAVTAPVAQLAPGDHRSTPACVAGRLERLPLEHVRRQFLFNVDRFARNCTILRHAYAGLSAR